MHSLESVRCRPAAAVVEHRPRKVQPVVRTAELTVLDGQSSSSGREHVLVERHLGGHLIGVARHDRKRELADSRDDAGDVTLEEEPADIGGQMVDVEFEQAVCRRPRTASRRCCSMRQREVAHRDVEEFAQRRARHRGEPEQARGGSAGTCCPRRCRGRWRPAAGRRSRRTATISSHAVTTASGSSRSSGLIAGAGQDLGRSRPRARSRPRTTPASRRPDAGGPATTSSTPCPKLPTLCPIVPFRIRAVTHTVESWRHQRRG